MSTRILGMSSIDYQLYLQRMGHYSGPLSGIEGDQTQLATLRFLESIKNAISSAVLVSDYSRKRLAVNQFKFKNAGFYTGIVDGLYGPNTKFAIELYQNSTRDEAPQRAASPSRANKWPTYATIEQFYGAPGTNHVIVQLPYPLKLAWDTDTIVNRTTINKNCADSFVRIMKDILKEYGHEQITTLRLDMFGGIFNNRPMRGGSKLSTHAYAAAIDLDPERNQLRWGRDKAHFARPEYKKFLDCWEREGWVSLGVERNFDWMHFQAVGL